MKKVYMFFVPEQDVIKNLLKINYYPDTISAYICGQDWVLYAYTTNKKYMKSFFQLRNKKYFHMTIRYMDEIEFKEFEKYRIYTAKLEEYIYENINTKVSLITTQFEFESSRSLWIDLFSDKTSEVFGFIPYFIIDTLNKKYLNALETLGLNAALLVVDSELADMADCCAEDLFDDDYILNVPDTTKEKLISKKVFIKVSMASKTLNSFIHIFKPILNE